MKTIGIICEYNPLHLGHQKQILKIREEFGEDAVIVCAMSGNYVQRGMPAIMDKSVRARAAISCGADLVLELPVTTALSSAEGFAAGGVRLLAPLCDCLCFGAETADMLGEIFGAMQNAVIRPGMWPLFVIGLLFLMLRLVSGCKAWIWALSPLFLLLGYLGSVVFSYINGVLFFDLLRTLINLASNGLFDLL